MPAYRFGRIVPDVDRGEVAVAVYRVDFRAQQDRYIRFSAQLLDQVVRHAFLQGVAPDDECHFAGIVGKVHCRLSGGVAGTDQEDVEPVYCACLTARCPKVNTFAKEPVEALDLEAAPSDARRENDGPRAYDHVTVQENLKRLRIDALDRSRDEDFRPEPLRLLERAVRKLIA